MADEEFKLPYIPDLVARKLAGPEEAALEEADMPFFQAEYNRLRGALETAYQECVLPEAASARKALNELLVRLRRGTVDPVRVERSGLAVEASK